MAVLDSCHELSKPDVQILTSGGLIPAHSSILKSTSPVLKNTIEALHKNRSSRAIIPIFGVPCDAVEAFLRFLYSSRCAYEELNKFGIHLLALSHFYLVPQLKQMAVNAVGQFLVSENVVDLLQLAKLCDAPDLYLKCMKYISNHFKAVETTEGWKVMQGHDHWLELDIVQFMDDVESRRKKARKQREAETAYMVLSEAMECLEHVWTEGCTGVGPHDKPFNGGRTPCFKFSACEGVQLLIKHFATCKRRANGGCTRCKKMCSF